MWSDEAALEEATRRLDDWESSIAARAARAKTLAEKIQALTGTAVSPDRRVQVTVDSSGLLVDLRLDESTRQNSAAHTARQILDTTRDARANLLKKVAEVATLTFDVGDPTPALLVDSYRRRLCPDQGAPDARR
jgi:hypothetical protein